MESTPCPQSPTEETLKTLTFTFQVTEKLLEAEKKKLTQLELQLDEETGHGISSIEKVS